MTKTKSSEIFSDKEEHFVGKMCYEIFFLDFFLQYTGFSETEEKCFIGSEGMDAPELQFCMQAIFIFGSIGNFNKITSRRIQNMSLFPGLSARTPPVFDEQSCVEAGR